MRRPALIMLASFSAGIVIAYFVPMSLVCVSSFLMASLIICLLVNVFKTPESMKNLICLLNIAAVGIFWYKTCTGLIPENHILNLKDLYKGKSNSLVVKVINEPEIKISQTIVECMAESILTDTFRNNAGIPVTGKLLLKIGYPNNEFKYGDRLKLANPTLLVPSLPVNPGNFDYKSYLARNQIYVTATTPEIEIIDDSGGNRLVKSALRMKNFIRSTIDDNLTLNQASLLKGLVIGDRGIIPKEIQERFQDTGTIHILAMSGQQISLIALIIFLTLTLFRVPLLIKQISTAVFVIFYAFIVGLDPPIFRAAIMSILGMIALTVERDSDILNVLAFSALIILFINPQSLFDASFQLSFICMVSMGYLAPVIFNRKVFKEKGIKRFAMAPVFSLSAQIGIIPIIAYYFYKISLISIIANLIIIPISGICVALAFLMCVSSLINFGPFVNLFSGTAWLGTTAMLKSAEFFNSFPGAYIWVRRPEILFICVCYLIIFSAVKAEASQKARRIFIYSLLVGINILAWTNAYRVSKNKVQIVCFSKNKSTLVMQNDKCKMLIKRETWIKNDTEGSEENVVMAFLRTKGIKKVEQIKVLSSKDTLMLGYGKFTLLFPAIREDKEMKNIIVYLMESERDTIVIDNRGAVFVEMNGNKVITRRMNEPEPLKRRLLRYSGLTSI